MRVLVWFLEIGVVVLFLVSCDDPWTRARKQEEANAGLQRTLSQLPMVSGFDKVNILTYEAQQENDQGQTCYYATAYLILGSPATEVEASNVYSSTLVQSGWMAEANETRVYTRGSNERAVIEYGPRADGLEKVIQEAQSKGAYASIIVIRVEYILPMRKGC